MSQQLSRGFSLIELMIAMLLGLMVVGSATAVFLSNKQSYRSNNALSQVQEGTRIAFELIARDLRQAGLTGCGNAGRVGNVLNNGSRRDSDADGDATNDPDDDWWANFDNAVRGYDGDEDDPAVDFGTAVAERVADTDSIQLIGTSGIGYSITIHNQTTNTAALADATADLVAGDVVIVCDPDHAAITQITTVTATPLQFTHNVGTVVPGNCARGLDFPTDCTTTVGNLYPFGSNAQVTRMAAVDWYIGNNNQGGRSLYQMALRNNAGTASAVAQEMVRNISDLQIQYLVGTTYLDAEDLTAANWTTVTAVRLTLNIEGSELMTGTDGEPLARQFTASVTLRNRVL